jgi:AAA15 family ATPase/GTPase
MTYYAEPKNKVPALKETANTFVPHPTPNRSPLTPTPQKNMIYIINEIGGQMFLRELTIENYKGFFGAHIFQFEKNLSFFVGNNNSGKSTVFETVEFLKSGLPSTRTLNDIRNKNSNEPVTVTAKFQGNIQNVISDFSQSKYSKYVFDENGTETLLARRTSEVSKVKQGTKEVEINIKRITLWNSETSQFENPSGIDTVFKPLFEAQFIWADTNPDDIADFGTTKICGRLLTAAIGDFFTSPTWENFTKVHEDTFHGAKDSLAARTIDLEKSIQDIVADQYGAADIKFNFQLPDPASFIKAGAISINDGADTVSKEKGTGMQRALALALIQLYAKELCKHPDDPLKQKPLFLFIDEPETFLHPSAQAKLLEALDIISKVQQVFVTTHSPYLLRGYDPSRHALYNFTKHKGSNSASPSQALALFGKSSPTWGEINYYAYNLPTVEFHNELYGFLQAKAITIDPKYQYEDKFENYLMSQGLAQTKMWIREKAGKPLTPAQSTLQTYIRNFIHHPENSRNSEYTLLELNQSITELIPLI